LKELIGKSLKQTLIRSLNTSLTTLIVLLAVLFFGGSTIQYFILALVVGIIVGTYSSLFIASPLLLEWEKGKN
jgi:preprotein translocase subunit SecF